jgi:hypothetical protein
MERQFLYLITAPLFKQQKYVPTQIGILCILNSNGSESGSQPAKER